MMFSITGLSMVDVVLVLFPHPEVDRTVATNAIAIRVLFMLLVFSAKLLK